MRRRSDNLLLFSDFAPASEPQLAETASPPADAAARASALDIQRSWIVEAPAGSGKTGLLMQRFLKLLAHPQIGDPAQVLACTFTRKATGELRERILDQLLRAHQDQPVNDAFERATRPLALAVLSRDAQLDWQLLAQPGRLNIRTLDSVAGEIAAGVPVLSAGAAGLRPTEDARPLYAEAARRTMLLLAGPGHALNAALRDLLLHRDGNLADCEKLITEMLSHREQWAPLIPLSKEQLTDQYLDQHVLPRLEQTLSAAICKGFSVLEREFPPGLLLRLTEFAADSSHSPGHNNAPSPIACCSGKLLAPLATEEHFDHWRALIHLLLTSGEKPGPRKSLSVNRLGFATSKGEKERLESIIKDVTATPGLVQLLCDITNLPPATYPPADWATAKSLFHVLARALIELQAVFTATGRCDFSEPSLIADRALRSDNSPETLGSFASVQHLLVDEMQDTSAAQYELLQLLTRHWDGYSQTVFLVGDPKQSIYLFRQARVERFVHTMNTATLGHGPEAIPLGVLHLTANFRSRHTLVDDFNHDFTRIFPAHPDPTDPTIVPYTPAHATRPPAPASRNWHLYRFPVLELAQRTPSHHEQSVAFARHIRRVVEQWRARELPPGRTRPWRIAVLVSARTHLAQVIRVFDEKGRTGPIPYRANKVEALNERQEILDLLALTRALQHPADRTAWLSLLRAPWCGLTLADLHLLAGGDDRTFKSLAVLELIELQLTGRRIASLTPDGAARLEPFHRIMRAALDQRGTLSSSQLVSRTWQALGAPAFLTPAAHTNAELFFTLLDELSAATGIISIANLNERLESLRAAPSLADDAVDLMTIHVAKGLEWDVVLLPALERTGRANPGRLLSWLELEDGSGIVAPICARGDERGPLADWINRVDTNRANAERRRLFYVACTRAREELHLYASPKTKSNGEPDVRSNSLLAAAWPAVQQQFEAIPIPPAEDAFEAIPPQSAEIASIPSPPTLSGFALAAAADNTAGVQTRTIHRIPAAHLTLPPIPAAAPALQPFERPQGTFAARAFGNTIHAFLELLAARLVNTSAPELLAEIDHWTPRVTAVLRAAGLGPGELQTHTGAVLRGLRQTLEHPEGLWLLAPHLQAASESALTSWDAETTHGIRLDRTFLAGPEPLAPGATHLWIVDFKTATQGRNSREAFLERESEQYRPQLETYAQRLAPTAHPVRLALYFPMLPVLHWWTPDSSTSSRGQT